MTYQAVFKRYELKYLLSVEQVARLRQAMQDHMALDRYGRTTVRNIYFDTDNYQLIRRSIEKPVYKEKLRLRSYGQAAPESPVFVELKKKYKGVVYKRRIRMPQASSTDWIRGGTAPERDTQITLKATDDGLNAAGGKDKSGFGGYRGGDRFGGMSGGSSDSFIHISGGKLYINASGDGIDSNGTLEISGGHTTLCGPTQGDTAVLDFDISGTITGGTFIGTGSSMMAQTFGSNTQGVIALSVGNQQAGTRITLTDGAGNVLVDYTPEQNYAIMIVSTPEMKSGESYTVTVGSLSEVFEAY